jgi:GT2 family glycosyltransferase
MIKTVLALVVDFRTTADAERVTCQLADSVRGGFDVAVVHVDNGNARPVSLSAAQRARGVRLVRVPHNGGYGAGAERTIARLRAEGERYDAYWILNSDLELEPEALQRLVEVLRREPRVGAIGPLVRQGREGPIWGGRGVVSPLLGGTAMKPWRESRPLPKWSYIPGCSILVRSDAYHEAGGMPERYGMFYEETHLCVQLQKRGWQLWVEPAAVVYHAVHSRDDGVPKPYQAYFMARNQLYFWRSNFGIPAIVQFPRTLAFVLRDLVLPLRRSPSLRVALDRLRFVGMGLVDGFAFLSRPDTHFDRKHFGLAQTPAPDRRQ